jgi:hypothetical protein
MPEAREIDAQPHHDVYRGFDVFANCMRRLETAGLFCSVVYARSLWEAVEGYNSARLFNPDKHFIGKVLRRDPLVVYVNRPLYSYRFHAMSQVNQQTRERSLRFHVDEYLYLLEYDAEWLRGTGVTREDQRRVFVNRDCLDQGLVELASGHWTHAGRLLAFAWATYPGVVLRQPKSWALLGLLLAGPVGVLVTRALHRMYKGRRHLPSLAGMWTPDGPAGSGAGPGAPRPAVRASEPTPEKV